MQHIKLIFESLCRALIRFFDNRFIRDDGVEWYRMELDKSHRETQKLYEYLTAPKVLTPVVESEEDHQPIQAKKFKSFEQKRRELETTSYQKAMKLHEEATIALARNQSNEELEEELGINHG